ncbi:hypothetical protein [Terrabacter sp. Ter38]|uniref:hypothetical protein n=1 Tax=Terrabacter sp. Ter38 TaxID=2926030 RepID=UPI0021194973|nr:hypothetical protein [Terrabacter sp. Ter38]
MKIAIIVDDLDPARRRKCFWEEKLRSWPEAHVELVSLLAKMEERRFFNIYAYDVVIFNWCVLDGALMFASDRVQAIVEFYDDHFAQFVRKGGIIIMENQPKRWRPVQRAYDILTPGQIRVMSRDTYSFGSSVLRNARLKEHPLISSLPTVIHSAYLPVPADTWFPPDSTSTKSIEELNPTKMYSGAFASWSSDWLPLLYTSDGEHPVMLVKTEGLGLWVVTTMYLASSNVHDLIEATVFGGLRHIVSVRAFHAKQRRRAWMNGVAAVLLVLVLTGVTFALLRSGLPMTTIPYGDTWVGNVAVSVMIALLVSGLTFLRQVFKRMWRTIRNY